MSDAMSNGYSADCTEQSRKYLINEYVTETFKEKLSGFPALVSCTIRWLYLI